MPVLVRDEQEPPPGSRGRCVGRRSDRSRRAPAPVRPRRWAVIERQDGNPVGAAARSRGRVGTPALPTSVIVPREPPGVQRSTADLPQLNAIVRKTNRIWRGHNHHHPLRAPRRATAGPCPVLRQSFRAIGFATRALKWVNRNGETAGTAEPCQRRASGRPRAGSRMLIGESSRQDCLRPSDHQPPGGS